MTLDALLSDVPAPPEGAWRDVLAAELKGVDASRLDWAVDAGVVLPPLVDAAAAAEAEAFASVAAALAPAHAVRFGVEEGDGAVVDEEAWIDRGAAPVTALAATVRMLREAPTSRIVTAVGPNVLLETARLRALRVLAARVRVDAGLDAACTVHARTARFWMSRAATHTNLLRATLGAVAATLGGADTASIRAHDDLGASGGQAGGSDLARRTASRTADLLAHESHLATDAAASVASGAFALDLLAARLAAAAWALANSTDDLDARAAADLARTHEAIASGRLRLVGTNAFASADDTLLDASGDDATHRRAAEPVEAAREAVARARTENGTPSIALLRFGDPALSTARATFARGLLATVGMPADETTDIEVAEGARLVVLCSSDADVQALAAGLAHTLASSCAPPTVFVAGPEDAVLRGRGVHGFVHAREPLLAAARRLADAAFEAHGAPGACAI